MTTQDIRVFESLFSPAWPKIRKRALYLVRDPHEADNLSQEVALRAFAHFHSFRLGTNFLGWIQRILSNCFRTRFRRRPLPECSDQLHTATAAQCWTHGPEPTPEVKFWQREIYQRITEEIERLPDCFSQASALFFLQGWSYQEIALALDLPLGTVRSRIHRARKLLAVPLSELEA